jgi:hypothetical protein
LFGPAGALGASPIMQLQPVPSRALEGKGADEQGEMKEEEKKKNTDLSKTDVLHLKTHYTQSGHPLTLLLHI